MTGSASSPEWDPCCVSDWEMSTERAGPVLGYKVCRGDGLWCSVLLCMVKSVEMLLGDMITVSQNDMVQCCCVWCNQQKYC